MLPTILTLVFGAIFFTLMFCIFQRRLEIDVD